MSVTLYLKWYLFHITGVFLPGLVPPEQCRGKDGTLNKPLCIAWSSSGRNHYIPIVAVKGKLLYAYYSVSIVIQIGSQKKNLGANILKIIKNHLSF